MQVEVRARMRVGTEADLVSPNPRKMPLSTSHKVAAGAPKAHTRRYAHASARIGEVGPTRIPVSIEPVANAKSSPCTTPTTSASSSAVATGSARTVGASPSPPTASRVLPSPAATSEIVLRSSGSLHSFATAYCAAMAAPAPPSATAPSLPM